MKVQKKGHYLIDIIFYYLNTGKPAPNPNGQFSGKHISQGSGNSLQPQVHNDNSNHQLQQSQQQHSQQDLSNQVQHQQQQQHLQQQSFQQQVQQQQHSDFGNQLHGNEEVAMMKTEQQHPMTPHEEGECASPGLPTVASAAAAAAAVAAALRTPQMHQNATHMAHGSNMPVQVRMNIYYTNLYSILAFSKLARFSLVLHISHSQPF